jgi:hypothetical protein
MHELLRFQSRAVPMTEVALRVEPELRARSARTLHPALEEPLIIDISATKPRRLTAAWFLHTIDVAENPPSSGICPDVATPNAPLFSARCFDALESVP